jgi:hypothetical protein
VLHACDIREPSCQRSTAQVAACLRGDAQSVPARDGTRSLPSIEVVDAEAYIASQVVEAERAPDPDDRSRDTRRALALLRLSPARDDPGQIARDRWQGVAAFFSHETEKITILDRGRKLDDGSAVVLLLHELIHAAQHLDQPDDSALPRSFDAQLAHSAIVEGEATLYHGLARAEGLDFDPSELAWERAYGSFRESQWREAQTTSSPVALAWQQFSYAFGGDYLMRAWRRGGNAAVRAVFAEPPTSTREIMAGDRAKPGEQPWVEQPSEVGQPVFPDGFDTLARWMLGRWIFEVFRAKWLGIVTPNPADRDSGFAGDVMSAFRVRETGEVGVAWRMRFATDAEAATTLDELHRRHAAPLDELQQQPVGPLDELQQQSSFAWTQHERDLILVASTAPDLATSLAAELTWEPIPVDPPAESSPYETLSYGPSSSPCPGARAAP